MGRAIFCRASLSTLVLRVMGNSRPAALCSHMPEQREQMVRYYGFYSHVTLDLDFGASAVPASP